MSKTIQRLLLLSGLVFGGVNQVIHADTKRLRDSVKALYRKVPDPALRGADGGPIELGTLAELLLGKPALLAVAADVGTEGF